MRCFALLTLVGLTLAPAAAAGADAPTVAILYFDYQGKNEEMGLLRKGLAQMLISDLSDSDAYRLVERDRLQDILDELKLNRSRKIDERSANRIGKLLGAQYMVLGGYFDVMGTLRVDARVVEVETGKVLKSAGAHAKPDEFLALEQKLAEELGAILNTRLEAKKAKERRRRPKKKTRSRRKRPKPPKKLGVKTALEYSEALDAKDRGDEETAKKKMKKVLKEQPDFALAQLDLDSMVQ